MLLVIDASVMAVITSPAERGAYNISTILPWIFPYHKEEERCENALWITCIAIKPGC
jgi:hypothetical protein